MGLLMFNQTLIASLWWIVVDSKTFLVGLLSPVHERGCGTPKLPSSWSSFPSDTGAHSQVTAARSSSTFQVPRCVSGNWALILGPSVLFCFTQALGT